MYWAADGRDGFWCLLYNPWSFRLAVILQWLGQVAPYVTEAWHTDNTYNGVITPLPIITPNYHANVMPLQTHYLCIASRANSGWAVAPSLTPSTLPWYRHNRSPSWPTTTPHCPSVHLYNSHPDKHDIASGLCPNVHRLGLQFTSFTLPSHTHPYRYLCPNSRCTVWHWTDLSAFTAHYNRLNPISNHWTCARQTTWPSSSILRLLPVP